MDDNIRDFDDNIKPEKDDCLLLDDKWSTKDPNFIIENRGNEKEKKPLEPEQSDFYKGDDNDDEQRVVLDICDKTLALLIDIENVSPHAVDRVFQIIQHNNISIRRAYGDWSKAGTIWQETIVRYAIVPRHHFNFVAGKNSSDIALVIDAMELLLTANLDGFCLVSSDSDFTHLVQKIREKGLKVYGFGRHITVDILQNSCHQFFYIEPKPIQVKPEILEWRKQQLKPETIAELRQMFHMATLGISFYNDGMIPLATFGASLYKSNPTFDPKNYGCERLADLAKALPFAQVKEQGGSVFIKVF